MSIYSLTLRWKTASAVVADSRARTRRGWGRRRTVAHPAPSGRARWRPPSPAACTLPGAEAAGTTAWQAPARIRTAVSWGWCAS